MRKLIFIFVFFVSINTSVGQSLFGTTGWLNIPSAEMQEDGTFFLGGSYINSNFIDHYGAGNYACLTYYFDITFLPWLEINFGNTRLLNYDQGDDYTVDRRFSFRVRPLKERKYVPAIVIGAHDVYTSIQAGADFNQHFNSIYIVATKHIPVKRSEFGLTLGYGFDFNNSNQYIGLFGGVSFSPSFLRQMNVIAEYDGQGLNIGANMLFFKHLYVYAMLHEFKYFSGGLAYRVYLLNKVKKKHKEKKKAKMKNK